MNVARLTQLVEDAALADDAPQADRVLLIYVSPGDAGVVVHRVKHGTHMLQGGTADADDSESARGFRDGVVGVIDALWPEMPRTTRRWFVMGADMLGRSPLARMLRRRSVGEAG